MPSKTEEYLALAQRTANGLTRYWESWTDYLTTASRLYKYSFPDQLMIYAQRPDATACADYDIWNNRMNRYVRRGSKGIALLDESSGYPRLHYVFDVSDTGVRRNSRDPERWEMNDDLFKPVSEMLTAEYGISHERLSQQLVNIAEKLVNDYWDNNSGDMMLLGTYRGFELNIRFDSFKNEHQIVLRGELSYPVPLGDDPRGNIVRLDNAIGNFADRIADAEAALDSLEQQKQAAEVEIAKPFAQEEELQTKSARLAELDALLNMEHQSSRTEPEAEEKPDARPSVLAALEEKADKVEPVRPFKSYLDKDGDAR